jgi:hypothetical protein
MDLIVGVHNSAPKMQKRIFLVRRRRSARSHNVTYPCDVQVTDAANPCSADGMAIVLNKFIELDCKLNVIGIDFDDNDDENDAADDANTDTSRAKRKLNDDDDDDDDGGTTATTSARATVRVTAPPGDTAAATTSSTSHKSATKIENERLLRDICSKIDGSVHPVRVGACLPRACATPMLSVRIATGQRRHGDPETVSSKDDAATLV